MAQGWRATARPALSGGHFGACRSIEDFELLACIGEGTYGKVWKARDTRRESIVALKQMRLLPKQSHLEGLPRGALREITLLKRLQHPNIVELIEVAVGPDISRARRPTPQELREEGSLFCGNCYVYLVFEYCERDLADLVEDRKVPFGPGEIKCILRQLLLALCHLHLNKVIHRDVKLSNILLNAAGQIKLADFGLTRPLSTPSSPLTEGVVTLWYRCPELLLQSNIYSTSVDMWATGCIFAGLLINGPFLPGKNEQHQMSLITAMIGSPPTEFLLKFNSYKQYKCLINKEQKEGAIRRIFSSCSYNCIDLLTKLLAFDPQQRITARDALAHPYFSEAPPLSCVRLLSAAAAPTNKHKKICRDNEFPAAAAAAAAGAPAAEGAADAAAASTAIDDAGDEENVSAWIESLCKRQQAAANQSAS